jgi:hypothetical protein
MNRSMATCVMICFSVLGLGCESKVTYDLRFVDAATGQPLADARFEALLVGHHFNNRLFPAQGKETAPPSDADGRTSVRLTSGDGIYYYLFVERTGYHAITGETSPWHVTYHKGDVLPSEAMDSDWVAASPGVPVVFKMRKLQGTR